MEGLTQSYGRHTVLRDFSAQFGQGVTALLGPNGAGKTTLLNVLALVTKPGAGRVVVDSTGVTSPATARMSRADIGYLPQTFGVLPRFAVREFVEYAAWLRDLPVALIAEMSARVIADVGLGSQAEDRVGSLSGGMRQRLGLAAALVGDPSIVILDEPTTGLDPAQRVAFRELLDSRRACTIILSTHLVDDVDAVADRIIVMNHGGIWFDGGRADLAALASEPHSVRALEQGYLSVVGSGEERTEQ